MEKYIEATGKTEEAAIQAGLTQLGLDRDDVSVELLERAKTGFLGIGSCPARVRITYQAPDEPAPQPEEQPAPAPKATPTPKAAPAAEAPAAAQEPEETAPRAVEIGRAHV